MRIDWPTPPQLAELAAILLAFIILGPRVGWRTVGVAVLISSVRVLRERRVGVGIEGREPSFSLTGRAAIVASLLGILLGLVLLLYPETFLRER